MLLGGPSGASTVTVIGTFVPEPEPPSVMLGVTDTVQSPFDDWALKLMVELGVTPTYVNNQVWDVLEPAATLFVRDGGLIVPPHTVACTIGVATMMIENALSMAANATFRALDVFTFS